MWEVLLSSKALFFCAAQLALIGLSICWLKMNFQQWGGSAVEPGVPAEPQPVLTDSMDRLSPGDLGPESVQEFFESRGSTSHTSEIAPKIPRERTNDPESTTTTQEFVASLLDAFSKTEIVLQKTDGRTYEPESTTTTQEFVASLLDAFSKTEIVLQKTDGRTNEPELATYERSQKATADELKSDRRQHRRCPFQKEQLIAAYDGTNFPAPKLFQAVICQDISAGGISFYASTLPQFKLAIVALTVGREIRYMQVEVKRTVPIEHEGKPAFLVGCSFNGRCG